MRLRLGPGPLIDFGLVHSVLVRVVLTVDLCVTHLLLDVRAGHPEARDPIDDVAGEAEAVDLVENGEIEGVFANNRQRVSRSQAVARVAVARRESRP